MATGGPGRAGRFVAPPWHWKTEEIGEAIHPAEPAAGVWVVNRHIPSLRPLAGSFKAKTKQTSEMNASVIPLVCQMVPFCERWLCFGQPDLETGIKIPARHNK